MRTKAGWVLLPDTPICVVVAVGAGTERASGPHRGRLPVILIVAEIFSIWSGYEERLDLT